MPIQHQNYCPMQMALDGKWSASIPPGCVCTRDGARYEHKELIQKIIAMVEEMEDGMKGVHFCRFNDGEQNCECYLSALSALKSKLKELL